MQLLDGKMEDESISDRKLKHGLNELISAIVRNELTENTTHV